MLKIKKIAVGPNYEGLYLFEFTETQKRGVFVPETDGFALGDRVEVLFLEGGNNIVFSLFGVIDWLNSDADVGIGVVFDLMTNEQFKLAINILNNVAYL